MGWFSHQPENQPRLSEDDLHAIALHEELHEEIKTLDLSGFSSEIFFVWQELLRNEPGRSFGKWRVFLGGLDNKTTMQIYEHIYFGDFFFMRYSFLIANVIRVFSWISLLRSWGERQCFCVFFSGNPIFSSKLATKQVLTDLNRLNDWNHHEIAKIVNMFELAEIFVFNQKISTKNNKQSLTSMQHDVNEPYWLATVYLRLFQHTSGTYP